jgi:hypothetical protein
MNTAKELNHYLDKRDGSIVILLIRGNGFIRVKPQKGLDIVMSIECFKENFKKITNDKR